MFDYPKPCKDVWEQQFDYNDDALMRIAQTPWEQFDFSDLWYYHHDLAYVELQPDLFVYLFPVCLMDWHQTLLRNESCSHGDSEFHYGVHRGQVFDKMLTSRQLADTLEFFKDSFLLRLDQERGFVYRASSTPAYGWMSRFNSLGLVMPRIDLLWNAWWSLETPGRAVAAVQYLSGLVYFEGENPLFGLWTREEGGGGPSLFDNDCCIFDAGWLEANVQFLADVLTEEFVSEKLNLAVKVLSDQPEFPQVEKVRRDLTERREIVESRVKELPSLLRCPAKPNTGWSL